MATREHIRTLFGYLGRIEELVMYPSSETQDCPSKVCYIRYSEGENPHVAMHLNNTVFIDRALIVFPLGSDVTAIPDELEAMRVQAPANTTAGVLPKTAEWPYKVMSMVVGKPGDQSIQTVDHHITNLGLPPYPPLPATTDGNRIEEIRRTVLVSNLSADTTAQQVIDFFSPIAEVKYARLAAATGPGTEGDERAAFVEFCEQASVSKAFSLMGGELGGRQVIVQHATCAIIKPASHYSSGTLDDHRKLLSRRPSRTPTPEKAASSVPEDVHRSASKSHRRSRSPRPKHRHRSRSRSRHRGRGRSGSRSRTSRRSGSKNRRSRSRGRRSRSRGRRSRSRDRGRRSRSRGRRSRSPAKGSRSRGKRSRSRERGRRSRSKGRRSRSRSRDRRRGGDRKKDEDRRKDKKHSKDKDRERERGKERDRGKEKEKEKEKERDRDRRKEDREKTKEEPVEEKKEAEEESAVKMEVASAEATESETKDASKMSIPAPADVPLPEIPTPEIPEPPTEAPKSEPFEPVKVELPGEGSPREGQSCEPEAVPAEADTFGFSDSADAAAAMMNESFSPPLLPPSEPLMSTVVCEPCKDDDAMDMSD